MINRLRLNVFTLLIILITDVNLYSQVNGFCATPSDIPNLFASIKAQQLKAASDSYSINVFFHIMRKTNGSGGQTQQEVNTAFNTLVSDYQPYNINISLLGTDEIKNDTYYNQSNFFVDEFYHTDMDGDGKFDIFSINSHSNAIDIYLFANDKLYFGLAANIPGTALVIGGKSFNTNLASSHVLSHEVGHCLGLYHTFHGTDLIHEPMGCRELVNGSNSATCGDFVIDTPADPTWIVNCGTQNTCTWNCSDSYTDINGAHYNPNTHLFMAYTFPNCMNLHTPGQVARIFSTIANSCLLQNVRALNISGPSAVCYSGTNFIVNNLPSDCSVLWTPSTNINPSSASGNPVTFAANGNGSGWIHAIISSDNCGTVPLPSKVVWVGAPTKPYAMNNFPYDGYIFSGTTEYEFDAWVMDEGITQFEWNVFSGGTLLDGQGSGRIHVLTNTIYNDQAQ